ncbi:leucine-rich repeat-containing protein 52 [Gracilinanus agilis]|uniref:leucine-rich repeat-containing protein 52 n=1 Tax=Gracilinanus agilis TaxID=191870 RepID=UPI001CFE4FFF|nr:leucine-rich repeat-containing protein 52 [Gracilinanus agilis]
MSLATGPWPWWLLFSCGIRLVEGQDYCPKKCVCRSLEVSCSGLLNYPLDMPLTTRQLILKENNITYLPAINLGLLNDLVYLDCSFNKITEIMDYTFVGVHKLLYLDLSFNNITYISPYSFTMLHNLVILNISNNPYLMDIDRYTLANNTALRQLDLSHTALETLPVKTINHLVNLKILHLNGNPWKCNCSLVDFTVYLIVTNIEYPDNVNATCKGPPELEGWPLTLVGNPLRYMCLIHLHRGDYTFLFMVGFLIFAAGIIAAWITGMCAVLCEVIHRKAEGTFMGQYDFSYDDSSDSEDLSYKLKLMDDELYGSVHTHFV